MACQTLSNTQWLENNGSYNGTVFQLEMELIGSIINRKSTDIINGLTTNW